MLVEFPLTSATHMQDFATDTWRTKAERTGVRSYILVATRTACVLWLACLCRPAVGEGPPRLTQAQINGLTQAGDRLADQGDFLGALEKYTEAYVGVVSSIRGQDFVRPVKPNMLNREQLSREMLRLMDEEYTDAQLLLMDSAFKAFGLMPLDLDSKRLMSNMLTEEVAGFYDPDSKRMVLIVEEGPAEDPGWFGRLLGARPAFDRDAQKTTLAHELTHALQDQLYDLNAMEDRIEHDDDMVLAFSALVEGDATLLMYAEAGGSRDVRQLDPDSMRASFNIMSWMLPLAGGETYRRAPPIFRESLTFPYFQGMLFAISLAHEQGWAGVHKSYARPPLSTEQVLHPRKYLDPAEFDAPQEVRIPDLSQCIGETWKHVGGNCLGELQTSILLKRVSGGIQASRGWDGDRYEVYVDQSGALGLVYASIWDSPQDANQFADAYRAYNQQRKATESESCFAEGAQTVVRRNDDRVWISQGFDQRTSRCLLETWNTCEYAPKQPATKKAAVPQER